jgi:hypothetical protein
MVKTISSFERKTMPQGKKPQNELRTLNQSASIHVA